MNKQAIVERVAREMDIDNQVDKEIDHLIRDTQSYGEAECYNNSRDSIKKGKRKEIGNVLTAAGHFDLLEAVHGAVVYECEQCEVETGNDSRACAEEECPHFWVKGLLRKAGVEVE